MSYKEDFEDCEVNDAIIIKLLLQDIQIWYNCGAVLIVQMPQTFLNSLKENALFLH